MKYTNSASIAAVALLATSGWSFAANEDVTLDANGDLRITLASGVDRTVEISGGETTDLNVRIVGLTTFDNNYPADFAGDIYIEADQDSNEDTLLFSGLTIPGSVNVLSGRGNDSIRFIDSQVAGIDVRARQDDDLIEVTNTVASGTVVLRGFLGVDTFVISGNIFQNFRIRGGRDDDDIAIEGNMFMGNVLNIDGRDGDDELSHGGNTPELAADNFTGLGTISVIEEPDRVVFAIAYTNVDGVPGFNESEDELIAKLVDGPADNPDGVVGPGDELILGTAPSGFDADLPRTASLSDNSFTIGTFDEETSSPVLVSTGGLQEEDRFIHRSDQISISVLFADRFRFAHTVFIGALTASSEIIQIANRPLNNPVSLEVIDSNGPQADDDDEIRLQTSSVDFRIFQQDQVTDNDFLVVEITPPQ